MTKKQVIIWGRFSSDQQAEGDSFDRQNRNNKAFCLRQNLTVISEYFDKAVSVKTGATPLFQKVVNELPAKVGIVCENLDRINRNHPWLQKAYIYEILSKGHSIYTSDDGKEYSFESIKEIGTMATGDIKSAISFGENDKRIKRVRESQAERIDLARQGKPTSLGAWLPAHLTYNFTTKQYDINEVNKSIIERIFNEYVSGKGTSLIARGLNIDKVITFGSKKAGGWTRSTISQLLRFQGVIGVLIINEERMPDAFPPAISEKLFFQVQSMLAQNKDRHGNYASDKVNNIFRGICHCAKCGGSIKILKHKYIACMGNREAKCNVKNMLPFQEMEFEFAKWFIPQAKNALLGINDGVSIINALNVKLGAIQARIASTVELLDAGLAVATIKDRLTKLDNEKQVVENELATKQAEQSSNSSLPDTFKQLDGIINGILDDNNIRKQVAALVPTLVKNIKVDISDRNFPSFECHLVNGEIIKWEYNIEEFKQHIKGIDKDGHFILGDTIVTEGHFKQQ